MTTDCEIRARTFYAPLRNISRLPRQAFVEVERWMIPFEDALAAGLRRVLS